MSMALVIKPVVNFQQDNETSSVTNLLHYYGQVYGKHNQENPARCALSHMIYYIILFLWKLSVIVQGDSTSDTSAL